MWSHVSVMLVPAWNSADYRVVAVWRDSEHEPPVTLVREGKLDLGDAESPPAMLSVLARILSQPPASSDTF